MSSAPDATRRWPSPRTAVATALVVALAWPALAAITPPAWAAKKAKAATAASLIKHIQTLAPGKDRDDAVDGLIEFGEPAWPEVRAALPALAAIDGGEDVVVDLLLGFGPSAWDEIALRGPKLSDPGALRLMRQVLRFPEDERLVPLLEALAARQDDQVLLLVLPELVQRNRPAVLPRLIELIDDKRPNVRAYAIDTLVARKHEPAMQHLVRRLGQERLAAGPDNLLLRTKLIHAIAQIGAETDAPVPPLLEALELLDQRDAVLDALQLVGPPAVKAAVYMLQTADRARIETALIVLSHLRLLAAPQLVPVLGAAKDETTRGLIADVLAHLAVPEVRTELLRLVRERKFPDFRQGLLLALTLYDPEVRKLLLDLLVDPDLPVRRIALEQLWRLADQETWPAIRNAAVRDEDVKVRMTGLQAMVGMGDPKAGDYLRKLVGVNNLEERLEVLRLLGRLGDEAALPALARQLSDPNDEVFRAALTSLRRLTFHQGPRREVEWNNWAASEQQRKLQDWEEVEPKVRRYQVDGRELGWMEAGDPDDNTVVVLAGAPFRDASYLAPHVWRLAPHYHVVVQQRGVGARLASTLSERLRARELTKLLELLGKKPVALLADASAGHFALRYANEHPKEVAAVILHGGPWPSQAAVQKLPEELAAAIQSPWKEDSAWVNDHQGLLVPAVAQRLLVRSHLATVLANPSNARKIRPGKLFDDAFSVEAQDRAVADAAAWDPALNKVPVLLLLGAKAPWATSTQASAAALAGPAKKQVKLQVLGESAGAPLVEEPPGAIQAIRDFLK